MMLGWKHLSDEDEQRIAEDILSNRPTSGPWNLEIDPIDRCNVNCFFCSTRPFRDDDVLDWELLRSNLEEAARGDLKSLGLCGGGESLLYPHIRPLLEFCGAKGLRISHLVTNGTPLAPLARTFVDVGTDQVSVSLNEPTAALYASTMRCPERLFHEALRGIETLRQACDDVAPERRPSFDLQFLLWKGNADQLQTMYELGLSLGVDFINIKALFTELPELAMEPEEWEKLRCGLRDLIAEDYDSGRKRLRFAMGPYPELNDFVFWEQTRRLQGSEKLAEDVIEDAERCEYCYMGWYHATIVASGKVFPCCQLIGLADRALGDLHESRLSEIWRGEAFQAFRGEMRQVMLRRGRMTFSPRIHRYIQPMCVDRRGCLMGFYLCRPDFYRRMAPEIPRRAPLSERLEAWGKTAYIKTGKDVKRRLRALRSVG